MSDNAAVNAVVPSNQVKYQTPGCPFRNVSGVLSRQRDVVLLGGNYQADRVSATISRIAIIENTYPRVLETVFATWRAQVAGALDSGAAVAHSATTRIYAAATLIISLC